MLNQLTPAHVLIDEIRRGRMVILVDDEDRENEGDLVIAAEAVTPEIVNFMAREARGLICLTLTQERCRQLDLKPMVASNTSQHETAFTVSIEAARGVTTGISAHDRATTILTAVACNASPADIVCPGHIFPLCAKAGGVLERTGHTEAGTDLARLAGFEPASVICEVMRDDGTMARLPDLLEFGQRHGIRVGTVKSLVEYRRRYDARVWVSARRTVMSDFGSFERITFRDGVTHAEHVALVRGRPSSALPTAVFLEAREADAAWIDTSLFDPQGRLAQALFSQPGSNAAVLLLLNLDARGDNLSLSVRQMNEAYARGNDVMSQILSDLHIRQPVFVDVDCARPVVALAA
ncbi:3,4-dihydroxy-2-butanone-4-phosphate synthase [Caballeronia sp. LP006]|uniref:3,4-dihydroxy-2-butanone-4-phosphate synthase n=1 Tax=Caballeronia sp. LP006 TaxID=3038552 RepID=UPI0028666152|nr:3,4-dihydroxy-2-butanone-4-phosphate synthase [Caballeronia sp. LP006]MDR5832204.1 3,4-dihydroxy-2-butanone-4-phosphate synthase [Caballeronia sp. LP006]